MSSPRKKEERLWATNINKRIRVIQYFWEEKVICDTVKHCRKKYEKKNYLPTPYATFNYEKNIFVFLTSNNTLCFKMYSV